MEDSTAEESKQCVCVGETTDRTGDREQIENHGSKIVFAHC